MSDKQVTESFRLLRSEQVIPDVIPTFGKFSPGVFFSIVWPSNGKEVTKPGATVSQEFTTEEPQIKLLPTSVSNDDALYTLVMTDPDAPSRADPKFREWRHWILSGIKLPSVLSTDTQGKIVSKPKSTLTPYYPPEPPAGSGLHRYVFLLFEEPAGGLTIPDNAVERKGELGSRSKWNAMAFAHQHNLKLVGANFFLTEVKKHE